jgi:hypothetical protein
MDSTVITFTGSTGSAFTIYQDSWRLTGIGFVLPLNNIIMLNIAGQGWRIDHCKYTNNAVANGANRYEGSSREFIRTNGIGAAKDPTGLIDNNTIINGRIVVQSDTYPASEQNVNWTDALDFGTANSVYIEDNTFTRPDVSLNEKNAVDTGQGGRYVVRYNDIEGEYISIHSHVANTRATKQWEIYGNSLTNTSGSAIFNGIKLGGGTGFAFDNAVNNNPTGYYLGLDNMRSNVTVSPWGKCDGTSAYDGEGTLGYPCRDQIGRGSDVSLLTTGSAPYPTQPLVPAYLWGNTHSGSNQAATVYTTVPSSHIAANRDYYDYTATFNGTSGVGSGIKADMPATCTTGVAYWATDEADWNSLVEGNDGQLYKCTATNTWSLYYTPYAYPHPLRGETGDVTAPTLVSATVLANGTSLSLVFSENVTVNTNTGFVLTATGSPSLTYASGTGTTTLVYTIGAAVAQSEAGITLAYTTGANYIEDAAGNDLDSIPSAAVVNNSTQNTPPTVELTVTKTGGSGCHVTSSPSGVDCGSTCTLTVDSGTVVTLSGWSENGWNAISYGGDCAANGKVTVSAAKTCTATRTQVQLFP